MAITYLPQAGSITEKNIADYWHGAMAGQAYLTGKALIGSLYTYNLIVYMLHTSLNTSCVFRGYAITPNLDSDLSVTLPANSLSYVYLVMDMAGGGTNTIGQRLVYYDKLTFMTNGVLLATAVTSATAVTTLTHYVPIRPQNEQVYPGDDMGVTMYPAYPPAANTERTTTDTTGELVKQFCVEYAGVYTFSCDLKNQSLATTTCYVYAASTGDTHGTSTAQLTFTDTNATYTTNTGTLALSEGDVVSIYLKTSNATYAGYIDQVSIVGYACVPLAPAFHIE